MLPIAFDAPPTWVHKTLDDKERLSGDTLQLPEDVVTRKINSIEALETAVQGTCFDNIVICPYHAGGEASKWIYDLIYSDAGMDTFVEYALTGKAGGPIFRKKMCILIRMTALWAKSRYSRVFLPLPPSRLWVIPEQIPFRRDETLLSVPAGWLIWDNVNPTPSGIGGISTYVGWIPPGYK